jgi:hypothetical protein
MDAAEERQDCRSIGNKGVGNQHSGWPFEEGHSCGKTYKWHGAGSAQPSRACRYLDALGLHRCQPFLGTSYPPPAPYSIFSIAQKSEARRIVGWQASRTAHASFVPDALEQTIHERRPAHRSGLIHHSDRGSQYLSIKTPSALPRPGSKVKLADLGTLY